MKLCTPKKLMPAHLVTGIDFITFCLKKQNETVKTDLLFCLG